VPGEVVGHNEQRPYEDKPKEPAGCRRYGRQFDGRKLRKWRFCCY
jgi:hypothetical protein